MTTAETITAETHRFEGLENIADAHKRIAKANARLEKAGIEERFEAVNIKSGEFNVVEGERPFQTTKVVDFEEFELNFPKIGYDGWTFVASVSFEEGGTLVNAVPGQSLVGWTRPEAHLCEHCGTVRNRAKSFVLRNDETGEFMQIGSSCLVMFLGVSPALWAVGFELPEQNREGSSFDRYDPMFDLRDWIALTLAVSENGAGFVSRGKARSFEQVATVDKALSVFFPNRQFMARDREYAEMVRAAQAEAARIIEQEQDTIDAVIEAGLAINADSDYGMNVRVVLNSEQVTRRSLGILSSVVGILHRNNEREAERKATPKVEGFLGEVKERIKGLEVTVTGMRYLEGEYGTTTLVSFRTAEGKVAKWFASGVKEFEVGDEMVIDATVKAHEQYSGQDQTMITRAKVK